MFGGIHIGTQKQMFDKSCVDAYFRLGYLNVGKVPQGYNRGRTGCCRINKLNRILIVPYCQKNPDEDIASNRMILISNIPKLTSKVFVTDRRKNRKCSRILILKHAMPLLMTISLSMKF